jgi:hypothetical protein
MKVVIAGGRGKIAPLLEQLLFRRGDAVTGITRNPAQAEALEKTGAQARPVNPEKATSDEVARRLLTFSDWLRGIWGEGQSGFGEAAVDELGVTLDVAKPAAEGAGEVVGVGECGVGHRPAP